MVLRALEHVPCILMAKGVEENAIATTTHNVWLITAHAFVVLVTVDYHVTKPVLKVHTARTVTTSVNATMEPSVLLNLVCVYVLLGGEDSNAICRVKNHFTVKIVKTNVNVKTMQRVVPSTAPALANRVLQVITATRHVRPRLMAETVSRLASATGKTRRRATR